MSRARRLLTPEADRPVWRAISVESRPATNRSARSSPVVGLHVGQGALQIDQADRVGRIATGVPVQRVGDVDDRTTSLAADHLAGLVGRDGDQPRTHLVGVAQRVQSAPRDRPGRLDGVAGRLGIAADDVCDAGHRHAMLRDELRERRLVTLGGEADRGRQKRCVLHGETRHVR